MGGRQISVILIFWGHQWLTGYHLEGILEEFKILPHPHSLMKVTWNDGSQGVVGG